MTFNQPALHRALLDRADEGPTMRGGFLLCCKFAKCLGSRAGLVRKAPPVLSVAKSTVADYHQDYTQGLCSLQCEGGSKALYLQIDLTNPTHFASQQRRAEQTQVEEVSVKKFILLENIKHLDYSYWTLWTNWNIF